ncbi:MAG: VWA domain-containing protein [Planctomycetota bacterium]
MCSPGSWRLWSVVNESATTKKRGRIPHLEVALYEYGNDNIPANVGHIRQVLGLTTDLDRVSEELFALRTRGGYEFCGHVIQHAVNRLAWSRSDHDYKAIFIAGNEPFTQGRVDYREACKLSISKGIIVNTIHCGSYDEGVRGKWKHGAMLADGTYTCIDQDKKVAQIRAPQDRKIAELNAKLNATYVPYGDRGKGGARRQMEQDENAAKTAPGAAIQRMAAKSSVHYRNASWDLVDAIEEGKVELGGLKEDELPATMQKMSPEERKRYLEQQAATRRSIQEKIRELSAERKQYVAREMRKRGESDEATLGAEMRKAVRTQAEKKGFE